MKSETLTNEAFEFLKEVVLEAVKSIQMDLYSEMPRAHNITLFLAARPNFLGIYCSLFTDIWQAYDNLNIDVAAAIAALEAEGRIESFKCYKIKKEKP